MKSAFHSTQNSRNFCWYITLNGPFRFGPTRIFETTFESGPLWPVRLSRSVGPKCPFPFDTIVVPRTALLYPTYKNNNQTRGVLGRVCATGMYRSVGHVKFPKFQIGIFVEWKAPEIMWCDLPLKRISFAVWIVTLAPIQIFWYFAPSSMSFSGSFYVSVKLPTYPSPKPKFCPK